MMRNMHLNKFLAALTLLSALLALPHSVLAQQSLSIDIYGPGQAKMNIVQAQPFAGGGDAIPDSAMSLQELIRKNLAFMPFLRMIPESDILGGGKLPGPLAEQIDFKPFSLAKVDLMLTANWERGQNLGNVELRCFEVYSKKLLLGKAYTNVTREQLPEIADRFCMELMALLTGKGDFFRSKIAFVKSSGVKGKDIWITGPMGRGLTRVTNYGDLGMAISPAWSWDGGRIAFTLIGSVSHYLGIWNGGKANVYTLPTTTVISPRFMPSGQVAAALKMRGGTDIYALDSSFKPGNILVSDGAIDVSPSFDQSGRLMAYVSDKLGNPNVFLKEMDGSERRVSKTGYNTNPCLSPDGKYIVYTRQMGGHKLMLYDIAADSERQLTSGGGTDENPSFAPDSYFIAFSSTRGGGRRIYVTTINGADPMLIPTGDGDAQMPSFCPVISKD